MNPIKVGLIGFGRMGGFYLEEMQKSGNWDIVYICDVSPASRELAQRLSPRSKVISDEQIIFNDPEIQVVGLFALADSRPEQIQQVRAGSTSSPRNRSPTRWKRSGRQSRWPRRPKSSRR